jgi:hypothetical protein
MFNPVGTWLMGILKGYLDDSGGVKDPNHDAFAFAGYLASGDTWTAFEADWQEMLTKNEVPYLHLSEFADVFSPLNRLERWRKEYLLKTATEVIAAHELYGIGAVVRLQDLSRFNTEKSRDVDARALALYSCLFEIYRKYLGAGAEIWIDRISKPAEVIDTAVAYAQSYCSDDASQNLTINALSSGQSFRNVLPMQAADFAVYEAWKFNGSGPRRSTHTELMKAGYVQGILWDYDWLCRSDFYNLKDGEWAWGFSSGLWL